jgi:hypothetical protein
MFTIFLKYAEVRIFQKTDAYSSLEQIKVIYIIFRLSRENKLYNNSNNNNNNNNNNTLESVVHFTSNVTYYWKRFSNNV